MSRSAYYKWLHRKVPSKEVENERIAETIEKIHTDADRNIQKDHAEDDDAQIDIQRSAILSDIAGIMLSLQ